MLSANRKETLHAVILSVSAADRLLKGRDKVACLSRLARQALACCARKNGIALGRLPKDENGAPLPMGGYFWSLSHKTSYVGAVMARTRIGIDIEKIRPVIAPMYQKVADPAEWQLGSGDRQDLFFRYWTAKEAVLKSSSAGLADLSRCRIDGILDRHHLTIDYDGRKWTVEHFYFDDHLAAVVSSGQKIEWTLRADESAPSGK